MTSCVNSRYISDEISCVAQISNLQISKTQFAQSVVLKVNFFRQRHIRSKNSNFIQCQEVEKWQRMIVSM